MELEPCWGDLLGFGIEGHLGMGFLDEMYWDAMIACMKHGIGVCSHRGRHYRGEDDNFNLEELNDDADGYRFL